MKTVVLGLGNPILCDDGVGPRVARELEGRVDPEKVSVLEAAVGGLALLDLIVGCDRAIIVDAIQTQDGKPGQIYRLAPDALDSTLHVASPHDVNFATALEFGRRLELPLPREIVIFAIEAADVTTFREDCTPQVASAIPVCAAMVLQALDEACAPRTEHR